jgi:large subunit ribosomal protein L25
MLNQGIRVRDLSLEGAKWKPISEPDTMIVHVVAIRVEEPEPAAVEAAAAAPAEPEVIKKGKTEKEEEK